MQMTLMAFMPWFCAGAQVKGSSQFSPEGKTYPSYSTFKEHLAAEILSARSRVCVITPAFEDRQLGTLLFGASRRGVKMAIRTNPQASSSSVRISRVLDDLRQLGVSVQELPLRSSKLPETTLLAIDHRAWSVDTSLSEISSGAVEVEAAAWTAAEVCEWARPAQPAKAATAR